MHIYQFFKGSHLGNPQSGLPQRYFCQLIFFPLNGTYIQFFKYTLGFFVIVLNVEDKIFEYCNNPGNKILPFPRVFCFVKKLKSVVVLLSSAFSQHHTPYPETGFIVIRGYSCLCILVCVQLVF